MQGSPRIDELRQKFHENPRRYFAPLANEYRKAGDPEQAIAICRAHLAQQPGHMSGHVVYAQSLFDAGRVDESRVVFEKALSLDPDNAIVLRYLGDICRQRGDSKEALHWYTRALDADPQDKEVAAYVAELTEPLTESDQKASEPAVAQSEVEAVANDEDEAQAPVAPTVEESPFVTRTMAELYAQQGHRQAALDLYRKLAEANPADADIADRIRKLSGEPEGTEPVDTKAGDEAAAEHAEVAANESQPAGETAVPDDSEVVPIPQMEPVEFADFASAAEVKPTETTDVNEFVEPSDLNGGLDLPPDMEAPTAEDSSEVADAAPDRHFTEIDIGPGDEWDTDQWGAGFTPEEAVVEPLDLRLPEDSEHEPTTEEPSVAESAAPEAPSAEAETADLANATAAAGSAALAEPPASVESGASEPPASPERSATEQPTVEEERSSEVESTAEPALSGRASLAEFSDAATEDLQASDETAVTESVSSEVEQQAAVEETWAEPANVESASFEPALTAEEDQEAWRPAEIPPEIESVDNDYADVSTRAAAPVPLGILNDARQVLSAGEMFDFPEREDDDHLVAYSPHTPDEAELAHFEPKGPTIREFFATLGARKLSPQRDDPSFTARAAVPGVDPVESHLPAPDAFTSLFADEPVAEEDSRAAFALSGALSATPQSTVESGFRSTPGSPAPGVEEQTTPAEAPQAAQESEDDIRKFREWLEGLADS